MPYDSMAGGNPGMPDEGAEMPMEGTGGYDNDATTEIPPELTGGKTFKPGDEIVLEVVSVTDGGGLVVKYATGDKEEKGESWEDGFRKEMSAMNPSEEAS